MKVCLQGGTEVFASQLNVPNLGEEFVRLEERQVVQDGIAV
jgi:hypothetical protein